MTQGESRKGLPATKRIQTPSWSLSDTLGETVWKRDVCERGRREKFRDRPAYLSKESRFENVRLRDLGEKVGRIMEGIFSLKEFWKVERLLLRLLFPWPDFLFDCRERERESSVFKPLFLQSMSPDWNEIGNARVLPKSKLTNFSTRPFRVCSNLKNFN